MARRGLLSELHRIGVQAQREKERRERENDRAYLQAVQRAEQSRKRHERAKLQLARTNEAQRKLAEKNAREAHIEEMEDEVERRNAELNKIYGELDSLLSITLEVDDFVDLNELRRAVSYPPFDRKDLQSPIPPPDPGVDPPEPVLQIPARPTGLRALFGKKKYERAIVRSQQDHATAVDAWHESQRQLHINRTAAAKAHRIAEEQRVSDLREAMSRYADEYAAHEKEVREHNAEIDKLISDLGYGVPSAVQEYVSIVLSNSVYPPHFQAKHVFEFEPSSAELKLRVLVPGPENVPTIKSYKYAKASDEIVETALGQKICKDRYAGAIHQVAIRSLHEVFEADRRGIIKTISLEVGTETIDPGTGLPAYIPFVAVGADRDTFLHFDLSNVVPSSTLERLGASISKNPLELVPANINGIRRQ